MTDLPDIKLEETGSKGRYFIRLDTGEEAEMTFSKVGEHQIMIGNDQLRPALCLAAIFFVPLLLLLLLLHKAAAECC